MTLNVLTQARPVRARRATFVTSPADTAANRWFVAVTSAAVVMSVAALGVLAPLVF